MTTDQIKKLIRDIPDYPKPGIVFRDITPLLSDPRGFASVVEALAEPFLGQVDTVLGIEARGFTVGAPVAYRLGVGLTIARKPGKLPSATVEESYDLEYGSATLQMHRDAIKQGARVLIVDDLLATGGTVNAAIRLVRSLGGSVVGCSFIIELAALGGAHRLEPEKTLSLIRYD